MKYLGDTSEKTKHPQKGDNNYPKVVLILLIKFKTWSLNRRPIRVVSNWEAKLQKLSPSRETKARLTSSSKNFTTKPMTLSLRQEIKIYF